MADRLIPSVFRVLRSLKADEFVDNNYKGDKDSWETTVWLSTRLWPADLFGKLKTAYENAYSLDPAGPLTTNMRFEDREGHKWKGVLSVEPVQGEECQVAIRIAVDHVG